jgi:hypothetical protein
MSNLARVQISHSKSAAGVSGNTASIQGAAAGSTPSAALQSILVQSLPIVLARRLLVRHHYLHSLPGGTRLAFGVLVGNRLLGALTLGVGPINTHSLVEGATPDDCLTLTRLWLSDVLPYNSESRVLGVVLRALKRNTSQRFLLSYADPSQGHLGTIYQATGWLYTGLSQATPLYDLGDGAARHSRSLSHAFGTHSIKHFRKHGVPVNLVSQTAKHRYVYFLDPGWRDRLHPAVLPYPKKEGVS